MNLDAHPNVHCVGAFDGEKLVGFAQLFVLPKTTFTMSHLEDVIVHPEYRNQGIGKRLVEEAISLAKQKGVSVVNLTTREERKDAVALFEYFGFARPGNMTLRLVLEPEA
ncbi:MAG: GCN5-related N-acetyltransferase [Candidatus Adlerbacteria bacterium]|nr:GCN5-related N-acetyltransferase [Candidatus Adlerbacteria bacterium]